MRAQTPLLSGDINKYARALSVGTDYVMIQDASDFAAGDTVMVIQMKGAIINASYLNWTNPGTLQNVVGTPGYYELLIIDAVNTGTGQLTFTRNIAGSFDVSGKVQVIRIRSFNNAVVNSELTCTPWDSTTVTGGVLAFIVKGLLTLNADINVNGNGFKGGIVSQGINQCQVADDSLRYYFYNKWTTVSGYKGEGLAVYNSGGLPVYPSLAKGMGVTLSGGGGGNGHSSGGGGGSNFGEGGSGDLEAGDGGCLPRAPGGKGGLPATGYAQLYPGIYLGGGGGASVYSATPTASAGGNGGGIVIILADRIEGNGRVISADGEEPNANTVSGAGAGGGGAGGSVIIRNRYYLSNPVLAADGGKGGNSVTAGGAGGGGGGGLIYTNGTFPGTATVNGGSSGLNGSSNPGKIGGTGVIKTDLLVPLNGFLFNEVVSSVTLNALDSICEGETPPQINGTEPTGGSGTYTFQWQRSYDNSLWADVPGTSVNYSPADTETETIYFRRIVYDGAGITDISKPVQIIVHPLITGNLIGSDTTICYNQDPEQLYPLNSGPGGGTGLYYYSWEKSDDNVTWTGADGTADNPAYDPPALESSQYYHRIVNSGACTDISAALQVTVLPVISNNTIQEDQTICDGDAFNIITGSTPSGGAEPAFNYLWKSSTDHVNWSDAEGTNNTVNYDPQNDSPGEYFYKRIVYSGLNNCCVSTSDSVTLTSHTAISGNTISASQIVCENTAPATIEGGELSGGAGAGTYTYQWQQSTDGTNFSDMPGMTSENLPGTPLSTDTWYRRVVYSSACEDISDAVGVTIDPAITGYELILDASGHDTICTGQIPGLITGIPSGGTGTLTYSWSWSGDNVVFFDLSETSDSYQPEALSVTTYFKRVVNSVSCSEQSVFRITVLPPIGNNTISDNQRCCNTEMPLLLRGTHPVGGDQRYRFLWEQNSAESGGWIAADGNSSTPDYQPPQLSGTTQFRRNVFSGENNCCSSVSDLLTIVVDTMPTAISAGIDTTLLPYQFAMNLQGSFEGTGSCMWRVISSDGDPVFDNASDPNTAVRKLGFGDNILEFKVENNTCVSDPDEIVLTVPELRIPEGISPNGDGINDYFVITGLEYTFNELVIINTGGAVVYRQKDYRSNEETEAWYGLDNNGDELPEGTYYYLLTIKGATDMSVPDYVAYLSGFVLIRR